MLTINNATVEYHGPLEILPLKLMRHEMDVNYFGTVAVTKAFLPLLHALLSDKPKTRYLVGQFAKTTALLKWLLPDRLFDRIAMKEFRDQDR